MSLTAKLSLHFRYFSYFCIRIKSHADFIFRAELAELAEFFIFLTQIPQIFKDWFNFFEVALR